ncbi:MAG TPA: DUF3108 domain-containing protein [Candidatus Krumholzibacteria bacterium]|nr:DUF3108 domain-containing protein [Candidatus Krumholzibacteria bacterium]
MTARALCAALVAAILVATAGSAAAAGAVADSLLVLASPSVYGPGEKMTFSIDYGIINAGDGTLEVMDVAEFAGRPVYRVESKANSNRFFSSVYKVRDKVQTYIDIEHQHSLYFSKRLREGDYKKTVEVTFDQQAGKVRFADGKVQDTVPGVQDVLSAFFYVRNLDLAPGKVYSVPAHSSKKTYDLKVIVHGRERVEVKAGAFDCFVVEPVIEGDGLFKHEGKLTMYITDDARRIPVLIKTKVPVGSIDVQLTEYRPGRSLAPFDPRKDAE